MIVSLASAGTLVKTFKKALNEKINESDGSETQPARPPELAMHAVQPVGTPLPLVWATPHSAHSHGTRAVVSTGGGCADARQLVSACVFESV